MSPGMTPRRFPPPWLVEEHNNACFIVKDATGQALGYFYFEDEPGRRSAAKLLSKDEARRMAANFAKPSAVRRGGGAPKPATPPNFNGPKQIAMVVRQFASAIGCQKFRAEVFRQRHPVPPTCTHAASWSRRSAANALTRLR